VRGVPQVPFPGLVQPPGEKAGHCRGALAIHPHPRPRPRGDALLPGSRFGYGYCVGPYAIGYRRVPVPGLRTRTRPHGPAHNPILEANTCLFRGWGSRRFRGSDDHSETIFVNLRNVGNLWRDRGPEALWPSILTLDPGHAVIPPTLPHDRLRGFRFFEISNVT